MYASSTWITCNMHLIQLRFLEEFIYLDSIIMGWVSKAYSRETYSLWHKIYNVLPLDMCIKYLNDLSHALSIQLRVSWGVYYISWSRHDKFTMNLLMPKNTYYHIECTICYNNLTDLTIYGSVQVRQPIWFAYWLIPTKTSTNWQESIIQRAVSLTTRQI